MIYFTVNANSRHLRPECAYWWIRNKILTIVVVCYYVIDHPKASGLKQLFNCSWFGSLGWNQLDGSTGLTWDLSCWWLELMPWMGLLRPSWLYSQCLAWPHIFQDFSIHSCFSRVVGLCSKKNSRITNTCQVSVCTKLANISFTKASHQTKLRLRVGRSNTRTGILRDVVHWGATTVTIIKLKKKIKLNCA